MHPLSHRLARRVAKTLPDFVDVVRGRLPAFVYGGPVRGLPVFTYHAVDPAFETPLAALREGGYRTVGADEVAAFLHGGWMPSGHEVVLTFDDGLVSLAREAVPLLRRYGFRALAFVVAGRVPARSDQLLAGWDDLRAAVAEGVLEVGSHSLWHHHVPVAPDLLGFVTPLTPTGFTADLPVPVPDGPGETAPGHPIFPGRPRYLASGAFLPDPDTIESRVRLVHEAGPAFFARTDWRARLRAAGRVRGRFETPGDSDRRILEDVRRSFAIIEANCPNPGARHLCYPWYAGDARTDRLAHAAGAVVAYRGMSAGTGARGPDHAPGIQRLNPEFLFRLPGPRRRSLLAVLGHRAASIRRRYTM